MTTPTDLVSISQAALNTFAAAVETEAGKVNSAVAVLGPYIQKLLAGQAVTLQPADVSAVDKSLTDLQSADTGLQNLEPPTPTP